jgi:hypothetical protein
MENKPWFIALNPLRVISIPAARELPLSGLLAVNGAAQE